MTLAQGKMFTQATIEKGSFDDDERSFIAWASKPVLDRDGEIIANDAWDIENYDKNRVLLWAHDYSLPPVGKAMWVKVQKNGMKFKPKFAPTAMGREIYELYKGGFLNSFSVGFIPRDFEEDEEETVEFMGFFGGKFEKPLLTYTDVELLEISCVPVPSCPDALVERMRDGKIKAKGLQAAIEATMSKTVIPFKHYSLDPEDATARQSAERRIPTISGACQPGSTQRIPM
jgi:HK97 family phage prohead protease